MKKCILIVLVFLLVCCKENTTKLTYPQIEKQVTIDTYHGQQIEDPYRNLENLDDPEVKKWIDKQNTLSKEQLGTIDKTSYLIAKQKLPFTAKQTFGLKQIFK